LKTFKSVCAAVLVVSGIALIAWLSYDAAILQESLRLGTVMDEAGVALLALASGLCSMASGIFLWRRTHGASSANAV
jgi:hypothetical protein